VTPNEAGKRRSATVSVRLDPKLRYLAEIAARKQRRTVSSFIEWAIEDSLNRVAIWEGANGASRSVHDAATQLWDVDECDRFAKLAFHYPDLLTHQEQVIWKLVRENGYFWKGTLDNPTKTFTWYPVETALKNWQLREWWTTLNQVARAERNKDVLPSLSRPRIPPPADIDPLDESPGPEDDFENPEDQPEDE
jgi:predicted transcriptional regulator